MAYKFQPRDGVAVEPTTVPAPVKVPVLPEVTDKLECQANEAAQQEYVAYRLSSALQSPPTLWIRRHVGKDAYDFAPAYAFRRNMHYDGNGRFIGMRYTDCGIQVIGRNLHELFLKLLRNEVDWIQEHDPRKWLTPDDESRLPIILSIKVSFKPHDPDDITDLDNLSKGVKH